MRRILTCAALLVCSTTLAFAFAQEPEKPEVTVKNDALDELLADFAAATANLDSDKAEKLFLAPDDTSAGKNRQANISEMLKDWKRAKESGASEGPAVQFKNTNKVIRTQMLIRGPGGPKEDQVSDVEFTVAWTQDGWKIVSMESQPVLGK